jgi:cephalosporin hydroxylase
VSVAAITPGVKPLTIIEQDVHVTLEEMAARVVKTREEHGELLQRFHEVYYNAPHTWHFTHFANIGVMKCPTDLWMYQELIAMHRPVTVIETGTYQGGSALWFAFLMDLLQIDGGRVITIDFEDHRRCAHPRITHLGGDSTDPMIRDAIVEDLGAQLDQPLLISLDADHSADHVRKELELYAPLCKVGDWLIVEDTNISWGGELGDRGAQGGVIDYLSLHPGEFRQDVLCERHLVTMHPGGWLQRVAPCSHVVDDEIASVEN